MSIESLNASSMDFFFLKDRVAIVTGGNSGLGQMFAMALVKAGTGIFIPNFAKDSDETKEIIEGQGVEVDFMQVGVTMEDAPQKVIATCYERLGTVGTLINNAGICELDKALDSGRADWDPVVDVNLTAAFELNYEAAKIMIPQEGGKIINICLLFFYLGRQWSLVYSATKHALAGPTKAYCNELDQYNIQVSGIAPGYYVTDIMLAACSNSETNQRILDHVPASHWGDAQGLMGATVLLVGPTSNCVSGHSLVIDNGYPVR